MGSKKNPFYRVVVADSRYPRDGRFIEELGYYNPTTVPKTVKIDAQKAMDWIKKGAKPTDTVDRLFKQNHVYEPALAEEEEVKAQAEGAEAVEEVENAEENE